MQSQLIESGWQFYDFEKNWDVFIKYGILIKFRISLIKILIISVGGKPITLIYFLNGYKMNPIGILS